VTREAVMNVQKHKKLNIEQHKPIKNVWCLEWQAVPAPYVAPTVEKLTLHLMS
jgi:hypothetical protein